MSNVRTKRILAIYNKMISIAQKGSSYYLTYYNYIDDLLANNEYLLLQDVFTKYFKTDIRQYTSIPILKQQTWAVVIGNSVTTFMFRLKDFYDKVRVYQIGPKIYNSINNQLLGSFEEIERKNVVNFHGLTYSFPNSYGYYDNTDLYRLSSVTYSVVPGIAEDIILKVNIGTSSNYVLIDDIRMSLLDKYKRGTNILLE
jgi:hypothetical protein